MQQRPLRVEWIGLIGLLSAILYAIVYATQRAIFLNGLHLEFADVLKQGDPADSVQLLWQLGGYYGSTIALLLLYGWLLLLCRRGQLQTPSQQLALLFPVLFHLVLLFGRPYLSIDLFNYMAYGYLGGLSEGNPYAYEAQAAIHTSLGPPLVELGWRPVHSLSPYGPLWTQIQLAVMGVTDHLPTAMLLFKTIVVAASLGIAALIWAILGRVRSDQQLFGTVMYLWNPVILIEFAAEGHNDALMILFGLSAIGLSINAQPVRSTIAIVLGALTKYLPLVFLLPLWMYHWQTRESDRQFMRQLLIGSALGLGVAAFFCYISQISLDMIQGLQMQTQPRLAASPSGFLFWLISLVYPASEAIQIASTVWKICVGMAVLILGWQARSLRKLINAIIVLSLILVLFSPVYWPWYVGMPIAFMALSPQGFYFWIGMILTICSRFVAPLDLIHNNGFIPFWVAETGKTAIGTMLPAIALLLCLLWQHPSFKRAQD